jgi:hypothetical protein
MPATKKKSPLATAVMGQLERLDVKPTEPKRLAHPAETDSFVVLEEQDGEWQPVDEPWTWAERMSEFPTDSAVRHFLDGLKWSRRKFTRAPERDKKGRRTSVEIMSGDENYEFCEGKRRRVLYGFAYDETIQYFFALDLHDKSADPGVYKVDHDGSSYNEDDALSDFLATLEPA